MSILGSVGEGLVNLSEKGLDKETQTAFTPAPVVGLIDVNPSAMFQSAECFECVRVRRFRSKGSADAHRCKTGHVVVELMAWTVN